MLPIIRDKDFRDAEVENVAFPHEVSNNLLSDSGQRFCFDLFSETVNPYNEELELPHSHGEGPHYVEPPLSEWPMLLSYGESSHYVDPPLSEGPWNGYGVIGSPALSAFPTKDLAPVWLS